MRLTAAEKYELIQTVTTSELGVKKTLEEFGIPKSSFYKVSTRASACFII
ncbi:hypothetical protein HX065_10385 [Myroides odoratimimus]|nr:hypothetical protein [Myroides odoratimimus]MDM1460451.1 hypothetical protein [Myroides odoratimimus]